MVILFFSTRSLSNVRQDDRVSRYRAYDCRLSGDSALTGARADRDPGVVGLIDHIKELVNRFTAEGFVALAPDLFHDDITKSPDQAGKLLIALNIEEAGKGLRGAFRHLLTMPEVQPKNLGALGFCMGG
jgi:hypothetical protein